MSLDLDQIFESFIREKLYLENRSPRTLKYFRQCWKTYRRIVQDGEITKQTAAEFVMLTREQGMSVGCLNTYSKGLNSFFYWLHANALAEDRVRIRLLRQEKKVGRSFTDEELRRIIAFRPESFGQRRIHALALSLLDTGCRVDELLSLTRPQIDFDSLAVKVLGKGNKERIVPISLELRKALLRYLKTHECALVFPVANRPKFNYQNSHRDFTRMLRELGIEPAGFHALRRTFAKNYLRRYGNLFYLKAVLGHKRLETTETYVEIEPDALQETHARTSPLTRLK